MDPWIWAVLLLVLGTGLALLEVFFPSAGILAFLSASALIASIVMGFCQSSLVGGIILAVIAAGLPTLIAISLQYWPKTRMGKRVLLGAPMSADVLPDDPNRDLLKTFIGRTGKAKSKLLLSGVITIDGRTLDAVSESMPVDVGQMVRVVQVRGRSLVVRPVADDEASASPPADPLKRTFDDPFSAPPGPISFS
jgi:membrane-bound serine protease (ClpP class)